MVVAHHGLFTIVHELHDQQVWNFFLHPHVGLSASALHPHAIFFHSRSRIKAHIASIESQAGLCAMPGHDGAVYYRFGDSAMCYRLWYGIYVQYTIDCDIVVPAAFPQGNQDDTIGIGP